VCCVCLSPLKLSTSQWWAEVDLNHRPPAYQAGALTPALPALRPVLQNHIIMRTRVLIPRKEVIQPHLPIRLPCYDFTPIIHPTVDGVVPDGFDRPASGVADSRGVTGGVYKARERIHRGMLIRDY